ncbi:MAG: exosortase H-associated membrane protein [Betaproteobacteria bacterium]
MPSGSFARFVLLVFAWLACTLFVWWFASPVLSWPVAVLAELVSRVALPDLVQAVEQHGDSITFVTSLHAANATVAAAAGGVVSDDIDVRHFTFGLPLLAALILAARAPHRVRNLLIGYAILLPFQTWGVLAELLEDIAVGFGPGVASQTGFGAWQREAIAFGYQFGTLILPTVVPAVVWVLMHRRLLEAFARGRTL